MSHYECNCITENAHTALLMNILLPVNIELFLLDISRWIFYLPLGCILPSLKFRVWSIEQVLSMDMLGGGDLDLRRLLDMQKHNYDTIIYRHLHVSSLHDLELVTTCSERQLMNFFYYEWTHKINKCTHFLHIVDILC